MKFEGSQLSKVGRNCETVGGCDFPAASWVHDPLASGLAHRTSAALLGDGVSRGRGGLALSVNGYEGQSLENWNIRISSG